MASQGPPPAGLKGALRIVGPGLVVAATGVGAGDMVAAAKAGATYGLPVLWTAVLGAVLKYTLAEGVARWQLATRTTVLEGWVRHFGPAVRIWFLIYLVLWTLIVAAALMAACGLAAHALVPQLSVTTWGICHALAAFAFVWFESYGAFERAMKWAIGVMFVAIVGTASIQAPPLAETLKGLVLPRVPAGGTLLLLGVIGGIGGTLTLLSYNYWMREKEWSGAEWMRPVRFDLGTGYVLTGIFGIGLVLLAGTVLHPAGVRVTGSEGVLQMAGILGERFGRPGELFFLVGFWAAVATSILGVWQGVPYLFADFVGMLRSEPDDRRRRTVAVRGPLYRGYLAFLTIPPMAILAIGKPVWIVVAYAAVGALFMPFLAVTLLVMNNRRELGPLRNGPLANGGLVVCVLLFCYLALVQIRDKVLGG
jgi:Mn2+/Fe2+ NRAMP family transporter